MAYFLTLWRTFGYFGLFYYVLAYLFFMFFMFLLFDVRRTFLYGVPFDIMKYFLMLWRSF